jgi:hypothetical protein
MEIEVIQNKVFEIEGFKGMLDFDLTLLYNVETRALKQAIRRNSNRFHEDFMFLLTATEINQLVSQIVIPSKNNLGGALPFAFIEKGIAMLSSVVSNSKKAIEINILIIRVFATFRQFSLTYSELKDRILAMESQFAYACSPFRLESRHLQSLKLSD